MLVRLQTSEQETDPILINIILTGTRPARNHAHFKQELLHLAVRSKLEKIVIIIS